MLHLQCKQMQYSSFNKHDIFLSRRLTTSRESKIAINQQSLDLMGGRQVGACGCDKLLVHREDYS